MPCGIRPSNVRVCHFTTRAKWARERAGRKFAQECRKARIQGDAAPWTFWLRLFLDVKSKTMSENWIKLDLHIHTLDDPKDKLDYTAHELLERAKALGFAVLAITLHDAVFDRAEVFADAQRMGILLIPAAEMRIEGADIILLNVSAAEAAQLKSFADVRELRRQRGATVFTIAPHPFYVLGGSIGKKIFEVIDCFDGIELCHFHKGLFNPNWPAIRLAKRTGKPLIATSDAHRLHDFGRHYTSMRSPAEITVQNIFQGLRDGPLKISSPPATFAAILSAIYFIYIAHPLRAYNHGTAAHNS